MKPISRKLKSGIIIDAQDFLKKYPEITGVVIPAWAAKGLYYAGTLLMRDAKMVQPFTPHKWGGLWDSETIKQAVSTAGAWSLEGGYNIVYAAKLHESPVGLNWTLDGSGPKFLEIKMTMFRDRYMGAVAQVIRDQSVPSVG